MTVTVNVPATPALTASVAVPGAVTLAGFIVAVSPEEPAALSSTVRPNPFVEDMVTAKVPCAPASTVIVEGLPLMMKSITVMVIVTV